MEERTASEQDPARSSGQAREKRTEPQTGRRTEVEQNTSTVRLEASDDVRLLVLTKDQSVTDEHSDFVKRLDHLKDRVREIHVIVLQSKSDAKAPLISRPFQNVWIYQTASTAWWRQPFDAYHLVEEQMVFGGIFHGDVIVAEDAYESGLAGHYLAKKYQAPFQLHIYDDFYDDAYLKTTEHPRLYGWVAKYLLERVRSVRTKTEMQKEAVIAENKVLKDKVETLPRYYNLEAWRDSEPVFDLREKYPQYKFLMLNISLMKKSSHSREVLIGAAKILKQYATAGLVIVGGGPQRAQLEKLAVALGIQRQVQFEPMPRDVTSHLKSAHVLIHLSEDSEEDSTILAAASVKLPIVALNSGLARTLFVDDESAQLCDTIDMECVSDAINRYLNENRERSEFALRAYEAVFEKVVQDYDAYIEAYKNSIERCMVAYS